MRAAALYTFSALALLVGGGGASEQGSALESHETAVRAAQAGDWAGAFQASRQALERDPDFEPAHRLLVDAAFLAGRPQAARAVLEALDTQAPSRAGTRVALAVLERRAGELEGAARHAEAALALAPDSVAAALELAQLARARRGLDELAGRLARAADGHPSSPERAYAAAHAYELAFRFSVAEEWLSRSERLRPMPEQSLSLARMRLEQGRRPECVAAAERGLGLAQAGPVGAPVRVQLFVIKARCEYEMQRRPDLRLSAEAALAEARSAGDATGEGDAWRALGYADDSPDGRTVAWDRAIALHEGLGEGAKLAEDLVAKALFPPYPIKPRVVRELLRRALELAVSAGDGRTEIRARGTLGANFLIRGQLGGAIPLLLESYEAAQKLGLPRPEAVNAANLSEALKAAGDLAFAEDYGRKALDAYRRSGDPFGEALTIAGLADLMFERRAYPASLDLHQQAAAVWAAGGRPSPALILKIARDHQAMGDLAGARARCLDALREAAALSDHGTKLGAEVVLAEIDFTAQRWQEGIDRLEGVVESSVGEGYEADLAIQAHRGLAHAKRALGRKKEALAHYRAAATWIEQLRGEIPLASLRTLFFREKQGVYVDAVDLLHELHSQDPAAGHDLEAFALAEHARARVLLEVLGAGGGPSASAERREVQARLSRIEGRLRDPALPLAERRRLEPLRTREEKRLAQLELLHLKDEPSQLPALRPPGLEEIQRALPQSALLVEFLLGRERSYAFFLSRERLRFAALPGRELIEARVKRFRALAAERPGPELDDRLSRIAHEGAALLKDLLGPAAAELTSHRELLIAPDGILFYLPFEALRRGRAGAVLAETHTIRYTPSAALLTRAAAPRPAGPPGSTLVAFGDPRLDVSSSRPDLIGTLERGGFRLAPLPASRDEVRAIASLFGPGETKLYLGEAFREKAVVDELSRGHRFVHFATHAVIDESAPLRSGIVLSRAKGGGEDGVLQVRELSELRISAELVTLSACQTGLGTLVDGEGMLGLARAFQEAGARSLVVSLWNVNDFSTAKFMTAFYRRLRRGSAPALALAQARREMLRSPNPALRHPYHWAGFVLIGG